MKEQSVSYTLILRKTRTGWSWTVRVIITKK